MINIAITDAERADELLGALSDQLQAGGSSYDLVVVGGTALLALGLTDRATRDVDLVAIRDGDALVAAKPLPEDLVAARNRVARDFGLPPEWLNDGPASLLDFDLPQGFLDRVSRRTYGPALSVSFASRIDQIHFKLYAMVDQGPGKHEQDLQAMNPTPEELLAAARWSRTHDPSEGHLEMLRQALTHLGVQDADLGAA